MNPGSDPWIMTFQAEAGDGGQLNEMLAKGGVNGNQRVSIVGRGHEKAL